MVRHLRVVGDNRHRIDAHWLRTGEKLHEVHEMTYLTQYPSPALSGLYPVLLRQKSCIDSVVDDERPRYALKHLSRLSRQRRKASIVADHQSTVGALAG